MDPFAPAPPSGRLPLLVLADALAFAVLAGAALLGALARLRKRPQADAPARSWGLRFPAGSRFPADAAAAWIAAVRPVLTDGEVVALGISGGPEGPTWTLSLPEARAEAVRRQLAAWFPEARLEPLPDVPPTGFLAEVPLAPAKAGLWPLRAASPREPDPLLGVLAALSGDGPCGVRLLAGTPPSEWGSWAPAALSAAREGRPLPPRGTLFRAWQAYEFLRTDPAPRRGRPALAPAVMLELERKANDPALSVRVSAWGAAASPEAAMSRARALAAQVAAASARPGGNALVPGGGRTVPAVGEVGLGATSAVLSAAELAALFHVPDAAHPLVPAEASRRVPPPPEVRRPRPAGTETVLGEALAPDGPVPFGLTPEERRQHLYVVGKTGTGKSTLLAGIARQDLEAGRGLALLDPHGDLAMRVLSLVPPERCAEVVYFDPADRERVVPLNPLSCRDPSLRPLAASGVIAAFRKLFPDAWGPRLEHLLRHALLLLLETPDPSLAQLPLVLTDRAYRQGLLAHSRDPVVRGFWEGEFEAYEGRFRSEAAAPVLNKLGAALASPTVRHVVGGRGPGLDLRALMDRGGVLVANLSLGRLGEDSAALLGGLLVAGLQLAAMSRADVPEEQRRDFALLADEFQHFATEAFLGVLSEARKYRLSLVLAHQYLGQVPEPVSRAVLGNAASLSVFRTGHADASRLARELSPWFAAGDLVDLPAYRFCARIQREGSTPPVFSARTLPLPESRDHYAVVAAHSRQRWTRRRAEVELEIGDLWEGRLP